jgi:hypothetical protein
MCEHKKLISLKDSYVDGDVDGGNDNSQNEYDYEVEISEDYALISYD